MSREDALHQLAAFLRDASKNDPLIFLLRAPHQEFSLFKFFHSVGGTRARQKNSLAQFTKRRRAAVVKRRQDGKFGHGQPELCHRRTDLIIHELECSSDRKDELEGVLLVKLRWACLGLLL